MAQQSNYNLQGKILFIFSSPWLLLCLMFWRMKINIIWLNRGSSETKWGLIEAKGWVTTLEVGNVAPLYHSSNNNSNMSPPVTEATPCCWLLFLMESLASSEMVSSTSLSKPASPCPRPLFRSPSLCHDQLWVREEWRLWWPELGTWRWRQWRCGAIPSPTHPHSHVTSNCTASRCHDTPPTLRCWRMTSVLVTTSLSHQTTLP